MNLPNLDKLKLLIDSELSFKILTSFLFFSLFFFILKLSNYFVRKKTENLYLQYSWKKVIFYISSTLLLVVLGRIWLSNFQPILTFLSIVAAALTITQKETLMNLVGSIVIMWRGLFEMGDRVEIHDFKGDVIGFGIFYFTLAEVNKGEFDEEYSGKIIKVPNSFVINHPVINSTMKIPYVWNEIYFYISPDSDLKKTKALLLEIANKHSKKINREMLIRKKRDSIDDLEFFDDQKPKVTFAQRNDLPIAFTFKLRFLCDPKHCNEMRQEIYQETLERIAAEESIILQK